MLHPCLLRGVAWWCLWPWRSWYLLCWYSFPGEKMHLCGSNVITLLKAWQVASKLFQNIFICLADIALQYFHLRSWFTVRMNYTLKARSPAVQQALFLWTAYVRMHIGECSCLTYVAFAYSYFIYCTYLPSVHIVILYTKHIILFGTPIRNTLCLHSEESHLWSRLSLCHYICTVERFQV